MLTRSLFRSQRLFSSTTNASSSSSSSSFRWIGLSLVAGAGVLAFSVATFKRQGKAKEDKNVGLDPQNFKPFKLFAVYPVTHNTNRYRFSLENEDQQLGLTVASCLVVKAPIGEKGKDVVRPYTPVSDPEDRGFFDLVIKTYPNGVMSKHFAALQPGQTLDFKGPMEKIPYRPNMKKRIGMLAGGTGLTPMYQILTEILKNPNDKTEVTLFFGSLSEEDIILKDDLDRLALKHKNFKIHYIVDRSKSKDWKGDVGYMTPDLLKKYLPPASDDNLILVCGPPPFMKVISGEKTPDYKQGELTGLLKELGYNESQVFKF